MNDIILKEKESRKWMHKFWSTKQVTSFRSINIILSTILIYTTMLATIAAILTVLAVYIAYRFYVKPRRKIQRYAAEMKQQGYRVYVLPFSFMGASLINDLIRDLKERKDILYSHKHTLPGHDVAICNVMDQVFVYFLSPPLISQLNTIEKAILLQKSSFVLTMFLYLGGEGLVTTDGTYWKNHRKFLAKVFNQSFIRSQVPQICIIAQRTIQEYHHKFTKDTMKDKVELNLSHVISSITSRVVLSSFLGIKQVNSLSQQTGESQNMEEVLRHLLDNVLKLGTEDPIVMFGPNRIVDWGLKTDHRLYSQKNRIFRRYIQSHIEKIRMKMKSRQNPNSSTHTPIIEAILRQNENENSDSKYSEKQIIDEIMTFALAGTDTTSSFVTFLVLSVNQHPAMISRLREEIENVFPGDTQITGQGLKSLKYLDCLIKEVNRMFNPIGSIIERRAPVDTMIKDIKIYKETRVGFFIYPMFYDPQNFEEPHEFRPERWEKSTPEQAELIGMAFAGGPRTCIGRYLAIIESKIIVVKLLKSYQSIKELNERIYSSDLAYVIDDPMVEMTKVE